VLPILLWSLAATAPAAPPQWALVGLSDGQKAVHFVDRSSITATADGASAWIYTVTDSVAVKLHLDYDCSHSRYRFLEASLPEGATPPKPGVPTATAWAAAKPGSPIALGLRYACSGGKIDLGFRDVVIRSASPEAFAREFLARLAAERRRGG
jgi:hypothetical protein